MAANSNGGGVVLLGLLALLFLYPVQLKGKGTLGGAGFHVMRFWGIRAKAPPEVVDDAIDRAADRHGVPRRLLRAVVRVESAGKEDAVSPKGAIGLGQIMPANARRCGLSGPHQLRDVVFNLNCSAQILAEELANYGGDAVKALKVYNAGPKGLKRKIAETEAYVPKVLTAMNRGP